MVFSDIIALAKAGYTPADVREFLAVETPKGEAPEPEKPETTPGEKTDIVDSSVEKVDNIELTDPEKPTEAADEAIDYKAQYEQAKEALKAAQKANVRTELPDQKTGEESFSELVASFM